MKTTIVQGRRTGGAADRDLYTMTRAHADETGRVWPRGTDYHPIAAGVGYQLVTIGGVEVRFPDRTPAVRRARDGGSS